MMQPFHHNALFTLNVWQINRRLATERIEHLLALLRHRQDQWFIALSVTILTQKKSNQGFIILRR